MVNRLDIIIKKDKQENMPFERYGNTSGKECHVKGSRKETQAFICRDSTNVECEIYDYTRTNWSHLRSNKRFKKSLKAARGNPLTHSLQKTTTGLLRMSHTIWEVLQSAT